MPKNLSKKPGKGKTKYVDGYVLVIPKKKLAEYRKMARFGAKIWMKYGALDYKEPLSKQKKFLNYFLFLKFTL
jgi:hypothetical protein